MVCEYKESVVDVYGINRKQAYPRDRDQLGSLLELGMKLGLGLELGMELGLELGLELRLGSSKG